VLEVVFVGAGGVNLFGAQIRAHYRVFLQFRDEIEAVLITSHGNALGELVGFEPGKSFLDEGQQDRLRVIESRGRSPGSSSSFRDTQ